MDDVIFDYTLLRSRIKKIVGTQEKFAKRIGLGRVSISQRLNNQIDFSANEMLCTAQVLQFPVSEIPTYFFDQKVQKSELDEGV